MTNKNLVYYASYLAYTIQGMVVFSLGVLMPHMMSSLSLDYTQGGSMIFFMLLGGMIASTVAGALVNKLGEKFLIILGAFCIITGYVIMIFLNEIIVIYMLLFVVGAGTGVFNTALNSAITSVSNNDHKKLNTLHTFYAIGAMIMTIFAGIITYYNLFWKVYLYVIVAMSVICVFLFSKVKIEHHEEMKKPKQNDFKFFANPYFYIFISLMFLYVGVEIAINGWIVIFLNDSGIVSNFASNYVLTVLWILVIIGRYINRIIKKNVTFETRLMLCAFLIMMSYIALVNTSSIALLVISVAILGLSMSSYYPNIIANISQRIKGNATALGLSMSFGGLGGAIIPWVSGFVADGYGLNSAMQIVIVFIGFLIIAATANVVLKGKE